MKRIFLQPWTDEAVHEAQLLAVAEVEYLGQKALPLAPVQLTEVISRISEKSIFILPGIGP